MLQTTLCYIESDGKYLMLHRVKKKNDVNHDKWIGIGGKFEEDESPYECVMREIFEETGLTPKKLFYRGIVTFVCTGAPSEHMHLFVAQEPVGEMKSVCDEGDLLWIDKHRLYDLTLWEGDRIFLRLLDQKTPFFSLKLVYENDRLVAHTLHFANGQDEI